MSQSHLVVGQEKRRRGQVSAPALARTLALHQGFRPGCQPVGSYSLAAVLTWAVQEEAPGAVVVAIAMRRLRRCRAYEAGVFCSENCFAPPAWHKYFRIAKSVVRRCEHPPPFLH